MVFEDPRCLRCRRCCLETEMILLPSDIERLESAGFDRSLFAIRDSYGMYRLRNVGGKCVFLSEDGRCRVYPYRPLGCQVYPLVYDEAKGPIIDPLCPLAKEFSERCLDIERGLYLLEKLLRELEAAYSYRIDWKVFYEGRKKLLERCLTMSRV